MAAVNTGAIAKLLRPGLNAIWGEYRDHPLEYKDLFDTFSSEKNYEEDQLIPGLGLVPVKPESGATAYDSLVQGITPKYAHLGYSLGFILTHETLADNLYKTKALKAMRMLAKSFRVTKETVAANVYNRAHNSSYTMSNGDGVVLCSTAHPTVTGNLSNRLTTAADMSEAAIEDMCIGIANTVDDRGIPAALKPRNLIYPTALMFESVRILKSLGQNDTANNATNALRAMGIFPEGGSVNHFLDDADSFFIRTDATDGMKHFEREEPTFAQDGDFDTSNIKYKGYERNSFGWSDFRGVYSNGGGA